MNYFELHIGDYAEACGHLSMLEDAAYFRMLRKYFAKERPLPVDVGEIQRLVLAKTEDERAAVERVLAEFFRLEDDGWHNDRADEDIARFREKQGKAKASASARWSGKSNATAVPLHSERIANALQTQSEGNALQSPDTSKEQEQDQKRGADENLTPPPVPPAAAAIAAPGIWDVGLEAFNKRGIAGPPARSLLGKLRQVAQGQCGGSIDAGDLLLLELLAEVERQDIVDPAAWLRKALLSRGANSARASPVNGRSVTDPRTKLPLPGAYKAGETPYDPSIPGSF